MDGEQLYAESGGRAHSACNRIGNVAEFEIEKDRMAPRDERLNCRRPGRSEQFHANLEPTAAPFETIDQILRSLGPFHIESDDQASCRLVQRVDLGCAHTSKAGLHA